MNFRFLFTFLLIPLATFSQEGNFKWQNPLPHGNDLFGCCCVCGHYAWAVGSAGTIMKSTDKGATWVLQESGITRQLTGVSFIDSLRGWACGDSFILHTADGGDTWEEQTIPVVAEINDIQFVSPNCGWAAAGPAHILKTSDGGENWDVSNFNIISSFLSVHFIDSLRGFVSGSKGAFLKTIDGGESWELSDYFNEDYWFRTVFFVNADTGFLGGLVYDWIISDAIIAKTTDGGVTWDTLFPGFYTPYDMVFTDPSNGYIACAGSHIYNTCNGGETWNGTVWGDHHNLNSLAFFDDDYAISVGWDAQVLRKLGGPFYTWKFNEIGPIDYLHDITFVDDQNGWAVGSENTLLHSVDGGVNWNYVETGFSFYHSWQSIFFTDPMHGWITGYPGTIIHTSDGGATWHEQPTNAPGDVCSIFFIDENYGWAVGEEDIRLRTTDGGQTWFGAPSFMWEYTHDVFFVDHLTGWVIGGYNGFINKTVNGGANWVMQYSIYDADLLSIFFTNPHTGWVVGEKGIVLHTNDSGVTWEQMDLNLTATLEDVFFVNPEEGWITGDDGLVMHTADGGLTWTTEPLITDNYLGAVFFLDENTGWICGGNGTILTYKPDNPVFLAENFSNTKKSGIIIAPNPCHSATTVYCNDPVKRINLYELSGKLFQSLELDSDRNFSTGVILELKEFSPGIYLIEVVGDKNSFFEKVIVY